ncbi:hypothetical protein SAMN05444580_10865 [Rhodococcus tukisamuensis]|uniref:Uncharacterized protein n=1 Tax=Rhodococcus tukisamuensis TaxID=168276 RepID=A0A1G6Z336_9NOCA|nr:hypothetical protein [Rhodococcus tukisamuensis]SDD96226.1 hypothetical protein SAMN05444580_10865 [Rhodococcus tukisamuensis]
MRRTVRVFWGPRPEPVGSVAERWCTTLNGVDELLEATEPGRDRSWRQVRPSGPPTDLPADAVVPEAELLAMLAQVWEPDFGDVTDDDILDALERDAGFAVGDPCIGRHAYLYPRHPVVPLLPAPVAPQAPLSPPRSLRRLRSALPGRSAGSAQPSPVAPQAPLLG